MKGPETEVATTPSFNVSQLLKVGKKCGGGEEPVGVSAQKIFCFLNFL